MKLAILGINYYPEVTGIGVYTTQMCEYLVKNGYDIDMFTTFPYYPFGEDFSFWYKDRKISPYRLFFTEEINGVKIKRVNFYKPARPNTFKRIAHELSFISLITVRLIFNFERYDLIFCISPPLFLGLVAYIFSRLKNIPFIFHAQDLQPDTAVALGMLKKGAFLSFLYGIEKFIYRNADYILTVSEGMRDKIINKGIAADKAGLLFNWVDTEKIKPGIKNNSFSQKYNLNDRFVVLHAGNMGEKQDMRVILEAASKTREDKTVVFLLVGRGVKRALVEDYIKKHNLTNILLLDVHPQETLNELFSSCDAALITQGKNITDSVMPSKFFGPAAAERPLIISARDDCGIARLARSYNFALVIPPEEPAALVSAIYNLKDNRQLAVDLGKNGRAFMANARSKEKILSAFAKDILLRYNK